MPKRSTPVSTPAWLAALEDVPAAEPARCGRSARARARSRSHAEGPVRLDHRGRTALRAALCPWSRPDLLPVLRRDLQRWQRFGPGLVHHRGGLDTYLDALRERDSWQRTLTRLPRGSAVRISRVLATGDRAFTTATVPDEQDLLGPWVERDGREDWWWWRVPARGPVLEELHRW